MSPFCLASSLLGLAVVRGGDDRGVVGVPAVVQRGDREADAVAEPRLDVVLEGDVVALAAVVDAAAGSSRPGRRCAGSSSARPRGRCGPCRRGARRPRRRAGAPAGISAAGSSSPPLPLEEPQPAAIAALSASTRVRTSRRVVFIATHRRRRVQPQRRSMDGYPTAPHGGTRRRTEGAAEAARTRAERRSARRLAQVRRRSPHDPPRAESPAFRRFRWRASGRRWTSVGGNVQVGLRCGGKWGRTPIADRGGGAPPTPPPRPEPPSRDTAHRSRDAHGLPRHLRLQPRREEPAHDPGQVPGFAVGGRGPRQGHRALRAGVDARAASRPTPAARCRACTRSPTEARKLTALLQRQLARHRPRRRRARDGPRPFLLEHGGAAQGGRRHRRRRLPRGLGPRRLDATTTPRSPTSSPTSPPPSAMLVDMTTTHVPVLAGELVDLLDPQPGEIAVDCTFGGGGHARLVAERLGPGRRAHRHRPRPRGRGALRRAGGRRRLPHALHPRAVRRGARAAARRGRPRRPRLPRPRHVLDAGRHARARLLLRLRRAAGHAHGPRRRAHRRRRRQHVGRAPPGDAAARLRRGALRAAHRPRDRPRARHGAARDDQRARRGRDRRRAGPGALRRRPPGQARLPGHPHRGQRRARPARRRAARRAGSCCAYMADLQGFPSIRWKTAA